MTPERLSEIEARANAATPGPWGTWKSPECWTVRTKYQDEHGRRVTAWPAICASAGEPNEANARFMAASHQDVPDLIAEVRRLNSVIDDLRPKSEEVGP